MKAKITSAAILLTTALLSLPARGQSTVLEHAHRQAMQEYPDLAVRDSLFNLVFRRAMEQKRQSDPAFFGNGEWPLILARSIAPERVFLKFTVFQSTPDGALLEAYVGTAGKVAKEVDWGSRNLLDGRRRSNVVVQQGVVWGHQKMMVFVAGLDGYYDKQSGEAAVYPAGDYNYPTVIGAAKRVPRFATSVSLAIKMNSEL